MKRISAGPPYTAYLRVYETLAAFPEPERAAWRDYVAAPDLPDRVSATAAEGRAALQNAVVTPPVAVPDEESGEAFVLSIGGTTYLCPRETRLRSLLALEDFTAGLPEDVVAVFWPAQVVARAQALAAAWRAAHPEARPHILTSTWHVPLRWFAAFDPEERELRLGAGAERGLVYRTPMSSARSRVAKGLRVLRRTVEEGPLTAGLEDLGRWLEEFHPRSYLELDYGGLVRLLDDDILAADDSAADVSTALRALAAGEVDTAAQAYAHLLERWRRVQALEHAN